MVSLVGLSDLASSEDYGIWGTTRVRPYRLLVYKADFKGICFMVIVRDYRKSDAEAVGRLIADTYSKFNLTFVPPERMGAFLGPFQYAGSGDRGRREAIARVIEASMVLVAEEEGEIVGVLRGRKDKLQSLFVDGGHHRRGIGRQLVERFEELCIGQGGEVIRLMATLYAVPFYEAVGYRKSTGVRRMRSFEGEGLPYQPMKKVLRKEQV